MTSTISDVKAAWRDLQAEEQRVELERRKLSLLRSRLKAATAERQRLRETKDHEAALRLLDDTQENANGTA